MIIRATRSGFLLLQPSSASQTDSLHGCAGSNGSACIYFGARCNTDGKLEDLAASGGGTANKLDPLPLGLLANSAEAFALLLIDEDVFPNIIVIVAVGVALPLLRDSDNEADNAEFGRGLSVLYLTLHAIWEAGYGLSLSGVEENLLLMIHAVASGGRYAAISSLTNIAGMAIAALLYELFMADSRRVVNLESMEHIRLLSNKLDRTGTNAMLFDSSFKRTL
ncbi:hypothetical protein D9756_002834 [Leucocoprinus leucothites]|uniref:Uncharacterized protein n=1 Tax=Leucocoprinus leucothites TaxID=201217 RepID=A0A8H5LLE2_9AGAR|nr:hypothetical protein D9756_002834 [Leucoagaricus leucothites]